MELKNLKTKFIGRNILLYEQLESTQDLADGINEIENGTCIVANKQTNGKGTNGRKWYTEGNKNIAMTIILFPNCNIKKLENITIEIAICITDAIKSLYGIGLEIKHPNDIMLNDKKLGGILVQTKVQNEIVSKMLIGIGMNINGETIPKYLDDIATSLKIEFPQKEYNIEDIIAEILNKIEEKYLFI